MKKPAPKRKSAAKDEPMPGNAMQATTDEMKYKAQDALHSLRRAEEIKKDSHLMGHVKKHAREERDHLTRIIRRKS